MKTVTIRRPDDLHVHFRLAEMLALVVPYTARVFARALVMPNTVPDIATGADARRYLLQILGAVTDAFQPLMTIRILPTTTPDIVRDAREAGVVAGKLYVGITTGSTHGISNVRQFAPVFRAMEQCGMVLSLHAEVPSAFCLDREAAFIPDLRWLAAEFPQLKIAVEHVTDADMVQAILELPAAVAGTITAHHLWLTLDNVVGGKLQPHHFCMPIAKRPEDREALVAAAMSGNPKFFFGSDTAPHAREMKECAEGCAGCFTAPVALESLAELFEREGRIEMLDPFVSAFGARFYGLPPNEGTVTLVREPWTVPQMIGPIVPWMAGREMAWRVAAA